MKRKLTLVPEDAAYAAFTNVVFLGNFTSEKHTKERRYIRVKKSAMTEKDKENLICCEIDKRTKIVYAVIRK